MESKEMIYLHTVLKFYSHIHLEKSFQFQKYWHYHHLFLPICNNSGWFKARLLGLLAFHTLHASHSQIPAVGWSGESQYRWWGCQVRKRYSAKRFSLDITFWHVVLLLKLPSWNEDDISRNGRARHVNVWVWLVRNNRNTIITVLGVESIFYCYLWAHSGPLLNFALLQLLPWKMK